MYRLSKIKVSNLQRFKNSEIELSPNGMWLVMGRNLDSVEANSNGAGKTGVFNAISWALTGNIPGKESVIIPLGKKVQKSYAEVTLTHDSGHTLKVRREVTKSASKLILKKNGKELEMSGQGVKKPQEQLNTLLGIPDASKESFSAFLNVIFLTFDFVKGFADIDTTSGDRVNLMTKFLLLDRINLALIDLRKQVASAKGQVTTVKGSIDELTKLLKSKDYLGLIRSQEEIIREHQKSIELLNAQLGNLPEIGEYAARQIQLNSRLQTINTRYQEELVPLQQQYDSIMTQLETLPALKADLQKLESMDNQEDLESARTEAKGVQNDHSNRKLQLISEKSALSNNLDSLRRVSNWRCPKCSTAVGLEAGLLVVFDAESHNANIAQQEQALANLNKSLNIEINAELEAKREVERLDLLIQENKVVRQDILNKRAQIEAAEALESKLETIDDQGAVLAQELDGLRKPVEEELQRILSTVNIASVTKARKDIQSKLDNARQCIDSANSLKASLQTEKESNDHTSTRIAQLHELLDNKEKEYLKYKSALDLLPAFRAHELQSSIPLLESLVNQNLSEAGSELRVRFEIKATANKTDFHIKVCDPDGVWRNYGTYSGGERQRIALACALAQRELTQSSGGFQLNFMMMDEVIDGLDAQGLDYLINRLSQLPGQYFLITHGQANNLVDQSLIVTRQGGISSFSLA